MNGLKFLVLHNNNYYHYILYVAFLSVSNFELSAIQPFSELDLLKTTKKWNIWNKFNTNWFLLCTVFMYVNIYNTLWVNDFSYKIVLIFAIFSKKDSCVDEIWLFWTAIIGSLTVFNGHHWHFFTQIPQCSR